MNDKKIVEESSAAPNFMSGLRTVTTKKTRML